jgi:hypothetical protein
MLRSNTHGRARSSFVLLYIINVGPNINKARREIFAEPVLDGFVSHISLSFSPLTPDLLLAFPNNYPMVSFCYSFLDCCFPSPFLECRYARALGAFYLRLTCKPIQVYGVLEPLLADRRKLRLRGIDGSFRLVRMDEFVDMLLTEDRVCDTILPHLPPRDQVDSRCILFGFVWFFVRCCHFDFF